ncbi:hypothetical protein Tco_0929603, partial [Tanacetum coccineum]
FINGNDSGGVVAFCFPVTISGIKPQKHLSFPKFLVGSEAFETAIKFEHSAFLEGPGESLGGVEGPGELFGVVEAPREAASRRSRSSFHKKFTSKLVFP